MFFRGDGFDEPPILGPIPLFLPRSSIRTCNVVHVFYDAAGRIGSRMVKQ
jgi:hypothetical protein